MEGTLAVRILPIQPRGQRGLPVGSSLWAASWRGNSRPALCFLGLPFHIHSLAQEFDHLLGLTVCQVTLTVKPAWNQAPRKGLSPSPSQRLVHWKGPGPLGPSWQFHRKAFWLQEPTDTSVFTRSPFLFLFLRSRVWSTQCPGKSSPLCKVRHRGLS